MKEIKRYDSPKYQDTNKYHFIQDGIYETTNQENEKTFVTSISFVQEPELEEGTNAANISQYPLEDILENFRCSVTDFYKDLNVESSTTCYLEFGAHYLQCIEEVTKLIGKHVYNKQIENTIYVYADDEVIKPLVLPTQIIRKNGTKKQKIVDVFGIVLLVSMLGTIISAIAAGMTKNTVFMILFAVFFALIIISVVITNMLGEKKKKEVVPNPTQIQPVPSVPPIVNQQTEDRTEGLNRKQKSEQIIANQGIKINTYLPMVPETKDVTLKDIDTICRRAIASLISIQLSCDLRENRTDSIAFCNTLLEKYNVKDALNEKEKRLYNQTYTQQDIIDIDWEYESYWSLAWALNLVGDIGDASKICDCDQAVHFVLSANNYEEFKNKCQLRSLSEILDMLDLYYRYHWAVVEHRLKSETNIGQMDSSVVQERRRGLEWLIAEEEDWYDISLDT